MNRNIIIIILVALVLILLGGGYFLIKQQQTHAGPAIEAVPINAAFIIQMNKPASFITKIKTCQIFDQVQLLPEGKEIAQKIYFVDSLLEKTPEIKSVLAERPILFSMHEDASANFYPLWVCSFDSKQQGRKVFDLINRLMTTSGNVQVVKYSQVKVYQYYLPNSKKALWYLAYSRGYLMLSTSELLLQDALRQTESKYGINQNQAFIKVQQAAGKHVDGIVYIQFKYFISYAKNLLDNNLFTNLAIDSFADWGVLDLNLKNNTWLLNGFSLAESNRVQWSQIFKGQQSQPTNLIQNIPTATEGFTCFAINDLQEYFKSVQSYMDQIGQSNRYQTNISQIKSAFGEDFYNRLKATFNNTIAQLAMSDGSSLFIFQAQGNIEADDFIRFLVSNAPNAAIAQVYKIDNETSFNIYELPLQNLPVRVFGPWFSACSARYICSYNNLVVMGDSYQALKQFLYDNILQKTLEYDPAFKEFSNFLGNSANFYLYLSFTGSGGLLSHLFNTKSFSNYNQNQSVWRNYHGFAWQFSTNGPMLYHNILFRYQPDNAPQAITQWETHLDTLVKFKPTLVENHNTGEKEIFVQDLKNTIYLVNNAGRIIWKKNIGEPILSEVQQIDYYKNKKLQYIFNTASAIYVIDRNGNPVEHYPIVLPAKTDQPVAVFDYENNKNYRLFVVCQNQQVLAYTIDGKTIPGFGFTKTNDLPIAPVQHFVDKSLDYIAITDANRIYIVDRQGKKRFDISESFEPSVNNQMAYLPAFENQPAAILRTAIDGTVYFILFDGSVQKIKPGSFSPNHYFNLQDVCSDKYPEMVYTDSNKVSVFALNGKLLFDYKFNSVIDQKPSFYHFSTDKQAIGVTETATSKIFLIDSRGQLMKGFPLKGKTRFSIGLLYPKQETFSLIVGGDDQYLYNYNLN